MSGVSVGSLEVAILKAMFMNLENSDRQIRKVSRFQLVELMGKFEQSIRFAAVKTGARSIGFAPFRGVVARAHHCGANVDRLSRFLYVLDTGFSEGSSDFPATALRSLYLSSKRTTQEKPVLVAKCIYALQNYLDFNTTKSLRMAKEMPWKIEEFDGNPNQ
jgi:hypothetical protein